MADRLARLLNVQRLRAGYRAWVASGVVDMAAPTSTILLADLARFCRYDSTTISVSPGGSIDPYALAVAEGRREVFLHIKRSARLSDADIDAAIRNEMEKNL
jgi:hypothetical protein